MKEMLRHAKSWTAADIEDRPIGTEMLIRDLTARVEELEQMLRDLDRVVEFDAPWERGCHCFQFENGKEMATVCKRAKELLQYSVT